MRRNELKILIKEILHEIISEGSSFDRFYWPSPNCTFHSVSRFGHEPFAAEYLWSIKKYPDDHDTYSVMAKLGWYRITVMGGAYLTYDYPRNYPPTQKQIKAIKDFAIESQIDDVVPQVYDMV